MKPNANHRRNTTKWLSTKKRSMTITTKPRKKRITMSLNTKRRSTTTTTSSSTKRRNLTTQLLTTLPQHIITLLNTKLMLSSTKHITTLLQCITQLQSTTMLNRTSSSMKPITKQHPPQHLSTTMNTTTRALTSMP
eukprot:PhF_6_TR36143/c2_g1_i2/m.52520